MNTTYSISTKIEILTRRFKNNFYENWNEDQIRFLPSIERPVVANIAVSSLERRRLMVIILPWNPLHSLKMLQVASLVQWKKCRLRLMNYGRWRMVTMITKTTHTSVTRTTYNLYLPNCPNELSKDLDPRRMCW